MPSHVFAAFAAALVTSLAAAGTDGFALGKGRFVAGGGIATSEGDCRKLHGTIAQDTLGHAQNDRFRLHGGIWAVAGAAPSDAIFNHGFQECR